MQTNLAYQEEFREELINGEIVAMSPAASNHNRIGGNIYRSEERRVGKECRL